MNLELYLLAVSITYLLTLNKASYPFRHKLASRNNNVAIFLSSLLSCPYCTGFHVGWLTYAIINKPNDIVGMGHALATGFVVAILSLITNHFIEITE